MLTCCPYRINKRVRDHGACQTVCHLRAPSVMEALPTRALSTQRTDRPLIDHCSVAAFHPAQTPCIAVQRVAMQCNACNAATLRKGTAMASRPNVWWAVLASVLVHAALVLGLSSLSGPGPTVASAPSQTSYVLYPSEPSAGAPGKLSPGDMDNGGPPSLAARSTPIVIQATTPGDYGPPLSAIPGQATSNQLAGQGAGVSGVAGGVASTSFFAVPAQGQRFVYVLDRSGSMGLHQALAIACRELAASLARLPATASFQVIQYNSSAAPLVGRQGELVPATADNIRQATAALEALPASGTTKHLPALQMALALAPDVIYFLTDGDDLDDTDPARVARLNAGRCVIHTIELTLAHRGLPDKPLQRLARENRGTYQAVDLFRLTMAGALPG
jgi:hypothetical protein